MNRTLRRWLWVGALYVLAQAADVFTSAYMVTQEGNVFARDVAYHPLIGHLFWLKLWYVASILVCVYVFCRAVQDEFMSTLAQYALIAFLCWESFHTIGVAIFNMLFWLNWYQP